MSAFTAAAALALLLLAAGLGCMVAFCVEVSQRAAGGGMYLVRAGGLIVGGVVTGVLASYL